MAPAQNVVNAKFQIVQKPFFKFKVNNNFDLQLLFLQLNCTNYWEGYLNLIKIHINLM